MTVHRKYLPNLAIKTKPLYLQETVVILAHLFHKKKNPSLKTKRTLLERSTEIGENKQIIKCTIYREN